MQRFGSAREAYGVPPIASEICALHCDQRANSGPSHCNKLPDRFQMDCPCKPIYAGGSES
jgi:hypothetical protein